MFSDRLLVLNAYYDDALADLESSTSTEKILGSAFWNGFDGAGQPKASFILFDLGLSMYQLSASGRGFSFLADEPLDMRFSPDAPASAEELVNQLSELKLADLIFNYGEERYSRRIAHAIVEARKKSTYALLRASLRSSSMRCRPNTAMGIYIRPPVRFRPCGLRSTMNWAASRGR